MSGSIIASEIDRDYKLEQYYKNKKKQSCKDKNCEECKYNRVCIDREV